MNEAAPSSIDSGSATAALGNIQGSNYGGHAPIVGAHVFVLEGYASGSGYYQPAKSLLTAAYANPSYPTALEPAGTAVAGNYYVTTDKAGYFALSGDYTCDAGYPVYLYAEGGNPQAPTASQSNVSVTGATISGTGPYTITFTASNLVYQGESLTFTGSGSNFGKYLNGTTQTVLADANLTTSTFDISVASLTGNGVTLTTGAQTIGAVSAVQTSTPNNPAVVNLAVLGVCPSTGTANFSYLNFVYMNEVSTAAAAYALGGFFPAPGTSGLAVAGASAANLSVPNSTADPVGYTLALQGIQNAALTASQLYDIQGSVSACTGAAPPCDGETHIALATTPGLLTGGTTTAASNTVTAVPTTAGLSVGMTITGATLPAGETITAIGANTITLSTGTGVTAGTGTAMRAGSGAGTVPQALLNTVGNILANCVDSANTSVVTASESTQCSLLFANTLSAGTTGTRPIDTATAAIDIAHNPWANVTTLVNSVISTAPFQSSLASANDLSVGIVYSPAQAYAIRQMAIDKLGRLWYGNIFNGYITALNPFGGVQYNVNVGGWPNDVTIDLNGNAWVNNNLHDGAHQYLNEISPAGVSLGTFQGPNVDGFFGDAVGGDGRIYAGDFLTGSVNVYNSTATAAAAPGNPISGTQACLGSINYATFIALDNTSNGSNLWIVSGTAGAGNPNFVCEINTATGAQTGGSIGLNGTSGPGNPSIDASGNVWVANTNSVNKITQARTVSNATGGTLSGPVGTAVDGAGNVFVANNTGNNVTEYLGSTSAAVSSVNFQGGGNATTMNAPFTIIADPSGFLWIANLAAGTGSTVTELLGVAAPTFQPFSTAIANNKLGSKP